MFEWQNIALLNIDRDKYQNVNLLNDKVSKWIRIEMLLNIDRNGYRHKI